MREIRIFAAACAMIVIGAGPSAAQVAFMGAPSMPAMAEAAMDAANLATRAAEAPPPASPSSETIVAARSPRRGSD